MFAQVAAVTGFVFSNSIPIDLKVVAGAQAEMGQIATIEYQVEGTGGKSFGDTKKRGLPFQLELSNSNSTFLDVWVLGMTTGSVRAVYVPAQDIQNLFGDLVPPDTDILITIELTGLRAGHSKRKI